mmetsp:Transcript_39165/g.67719  ORF Transcript_39165/g.67719 Transcript_39165/m.67719 type:complete len:317 (-) Transcript_39165:408-1358(-)
MDSLSLPEAKLFLFASKLPAFDKAILKELIIEEDKTIFEALESYQRMKDRDAYKQAVLTAVITKTVNLTSDWWDEIFADCSTNEAKKLAKAAKARLGGGGELRSSLVYGEVDFPSFAALLEKARPQPGEVLVDLGHGTGRALVAAGLLHGHTFREIVGVELLEELHGASLRALEAYARVERRERALYGGHPRAAVRALRGDITAVPRGEGEEGEGGGPAAAAAAAAAEGSYDWTRADVVFANSTCFDAALMETISKLGEYLRPGARFITLTKKLTSDKFDVLERRQYAMSWGPATCFIQVRKKDDSNNEEKEDSTS